jgi:hypothetical protein
MGAIMLIKTLGILLVCAGFMSSTFFFLVMALTAPLQ